MTFRGDGGRPGSADVVRDEVETVAVCAVDVDVIVVGNAGFDAKGVLIKPIACDLPVITTLLQHDRAARLVGAEAVVEMAVRHGIGFVHLGRILRTIVEKALAGQVGITGAEVAVVDDVVAGAAIVAGRKNQVASRIS